MPQNAKNTAYVLRFFNKIFDTLNGRELMTATSQHIAILKDAKGVLNKMRFVDKVDHRKSEPLPSLNNLIVTIDSVLRLWNVLEGLGFKSLNTKLLNQDPMENYFGRVRSQGVKNHRPTPLQFKFIAKSLLMDNLTSDHSPGSNCAADDERFIFSWADYKEEITPVTPDLSIPSNVNEPNFSDNSGPLPSIRAAAKALARFIRNKNCDQCKAMFDKDPGTLVETLVNDTRPVLKKVIAKIFTLNNIKKRALIFLKREINFDIFSCKEHRNCLVDLFLNCIIQEYINSVITYINRILVGKIFIKEKNQHSVVLAAHEKYVKKLNKANRPEQLQ